MKPSVKMMMLANRGNSGEMRYRAGGEPSGYSGGGAENRIHDGRGRERYNNGRYAPRSEMEGGYNRMEQARSEMRYEAPRSGTGYRIEDGTRMIGFYGGEPEYRSDYRMDAGYQSKDEFSHGKSQKQGGHASSSMKGMDKRTAKEWVKQMKNSDKSSGETWEWEKVQKLMERWNVKLDPTEFYATINMLYSDYGAVAMKYGITGTEFWVDLAKAFLEDEDAKEDKLQLYYECIVK